jgi:hypothetical protein
MNEVVLTDIWENGQITIIFWNDPRSTRGTLKDEKQSKELPVGQDYHHVYLTPFYNLATIARAVFNCKSLSYQLPVRVRVAVRAVLFCNTRFLIFFGKIFIFCALISCCFM